MKGFLRRGRKRRGRETVSINTMIGERAKIEGNIFADGSLKADGEVNGDIHSSCDIIIDRSAHITGNLSARAVFVSGTVVGNIVATGELSVSSTARIKGEIIAGSLVIEEGAELIGTCQVNENERD